MVKQSISLLAIAGVVSALSLPEFMFDHTSYKRDDISDCDYDDCPILSSLDLAKACDRDPTTWNDRKVAANIWWGIGAGLFLDNWIRSTYLDKGASPDNWLQAMNDEFNSDGDDLDNTIWDCATVDEGSCKISVSCEDYFNDGSSDMYYINFAAMQVHAAYATLHENLQDWAISTNFDVSSAVSDFVGDVKGVNFNAIASGAFSIASGLTAGVGPVRGTFGVFSGAFGVAAGLDDDEPDPKVSLNDLMGSYFDATREAIQSTLNNVFGVGDYNMDDLPAQTEDNYKQTPLGRFFADGKWLTFNVQEVLSTAIDAGNALMSNSIIIAALKQQGYFVYVDTDKITAEECSGQPSMMYIGDMCYTLVERIGEFCSPFNPDGCTHSVVYIAEDKWNQLVDENGRYKLNGQDFFTTAYDCKKSFPDGSGNIDVTTLTYNGVVPKCFCNLDVRKGVYEVAKNIGRFEKLQWMRAVLSGLAGVVICSVSV